MLFIDFISRFGSPFTLMKCVAATCEKGDPDGYEDFCALLHRRHKVQVTRVGQSDLEVTNEANTCQVIVDLTPNVVWIKSITTDNPYEIEDVLSKVIVYTPEYVFNAPIIARSPLSQISIGSTRLSGEQIEKMIVIDDGQMIDLYDIMGEFKI